MNYIKHLTGFFNCIGNEKIIYPTHISLYLALFQSWNVNRFKNPITISREEMMKASRIASKATYHKCIKELQFLGFIEYLPSYNPYHGTEVIMYNLSDGNKRRGSSIIDNTKPIIEQVNGQVTEHVIEPHIYNNKQTFKNNKNISIEGNFEVSIEEDYLEADKKEKKSSAKKKESPSIELVKEYFKLQEYSEIEAERFFNYYTSNGWLIGGKTQMKDWNAAARNWMLTTSKFSINLPKSKEQSRANNLHTQEDKDYAEPL
ncbi:transcriptional regulator [Flavobacterium amniphilum]|uniref:transcriptional regulator n=1 Tax=Flavobacterium amniphilum TaxID=1834035 RepID=UPI00202ABEF2|nr:transcriptional regulator [Flavobacterium amniphilum]MCL9806966.1 transcriptional regulator [Flavobacterium amniphilum]